MTAAGEQSGSTGRGGRLRNVMMTAVAFALYSWRFTPWLLAARLDGKDG